MTGFFWGREAELKDLARIDQQKKAGLVVCLGRRRIGKSRLIQEFAKNIPNFIEIQGLGPREAQTNQDQLNWFAKELARQTKMPEVIYKDWGDAFQVLATYFGNKHTLIFLDEISWMGQHDPDFAGKLKIAWDLYFKKNSKLRLVVCGSVSAWIQKNILESTDFVGRISLELCLKELPLKDAHRFWGKKSRQVSSLEKLRILSLTGGVPRYLEEINYNQSAEENYKNLCFSKNGFLFTEFLKIFNDVFGRRTTSYQKIIQALISGPRNLTNIGKVAKLPANGTLVQYLSDLDISGFVRKEIMWDFKNLKDKDKTIRYRLSDNYLRFYLKYISPNATKIEKGLYKESGIEKLPVFDSFVGLQFENIVLNNYIDVCKVLNIGLTSVLNVGSYFQTETARQKSCQIDLIIQTKNTLYVCELKARREVDVSVIEEVKKKIKILKRPSTLSVRTVLIYAGELNQEVVDEDYFDEIISFDRLLV
jgi:AAA+ ATPase superfamily predicted ATPase